MTHPEGGKAPRKDAGTFRTVPLQDQLAMCELYVATGSPKAVCAAFNRSRNLVHRVLAAHKVPRKKDRP